MELSKKELSTIIKIFTARHKSVFYQNMSLVNKKELAENLTNAYNEKRLITSFSKSGQLNYLITFKKTFMGEFDEHFFYVSSCYCVNSKTTRKQFYKKIIEASLEMKKTEKVKRMLIQVNSDDLLSKKYFSRNGELTYRELVGKTKKGLKALDSISTEGTKFCIEKLQKKDIKKLVKLDRESHVMDKTSRMRKVFMKPGAEKKLVKFYNGLFKNKTCLVVKEGSIPAGTVGYFIDKKNKVGLIASIFVANDFKGRGISKLLYKNLLKEFSKKKLDYYIGSSTTSNVLSSAEKMGRFESKSAYILKI